MEDLNISISANEGTTVQVSFLDIAGKAVTPKVAILGENKSNLQSLQTALKVIEDAIRKTEQASTPGASYYILKNGIRVSTTEKQTDKEEAI